MLCMKLRLPLFATLLSLLPCSLAHGHIRYLTIGGQGYNGFNPSWPPELGPTPIRPTDNADQGWADYWSSIVATGGMNPGQNVLTAKGNAGDRVEMFWIVWDNSHKGSVTEWMAYCGQESCDGIPGADLDWFKIQEDSFADGHWPTERINYDTNHTWSFNLPTDLRSGKYLVRHELLAMHTVNEPQFYPVTFQLDLTSSGSTVPSPIGRFPDMYMHDNAATWHNIYSDDNNKFKVPGIPVYSRSESGSASAGGSGSGVPAPDLSYRPPASGSSSHRSSCKAGRRRRRSRK